MQFEVIEADVLESLEAKLAGKPLPNDTEVTIEEPDADGRVKVSFVKDRTWMAVVLRADLLKEPRTLEDIAYEVAREFNKTRVCG